MNRSDWKTVFASRFRCREEEMEGLFTALYHNDRQAWDGFADMLYAAWVQRPEPLKALDWEREDAPGWYRSRELAGMAVDVRAYGGTIRGAAQKLDHIAGCGVNYLHLTPLLDGEKGREGGWAVRDHGKILPELGGMEDLAVLAEACHDRGIALGLDFPLAHTAGDHPWARRAMAGEKAYQARYFFYDSWDIPNLYDSALTPALPSAPGNFTWCPEAGKLVMTTGRPDQWDLNYANPAVLREMVHQMLRLCNLGADVIRLGAVDRLWKTPGTPCRGLQQTHALVRLMRLACEIVCPGVALQGEVQGEPWQAAAYFGPADRPECHLMEDDGLMAAIWHTAAARDARLLAHRLEGLFSLPGEFAHAVSNGEPIDWKLDFGFLRSLGNQEPHHRRYLNDYLTGIWPGSPARGELFYPDPRRETAQVCGRTASLCGVEAAREKGDEAALERALRLDLALHALLFTLPGVPMLWCGDEIAQENGGAAPHPGRDGGAPSGKVYDGIARLLALRAEYRVFDSDADAWVAPTWNDRVLGVGRYRAGEKLIALFNFDGEEQTAYVQDPAEYTDLLTGDVGVALAVPVPAGGCRWLYRKMEEEG